MAEALISVVLDQFAAVIREEVEQEVRLVVNVRKQVKDLTTTLTMLQAFLRDADVKQVKDGAVKVWLEELKDIAYDADDVLDEWRTRILLSQLNPMATSITKKITNRLFSPYSFFKPIVLRHQIGHEINDIKERLVMISRAKAQLNLDASQIQQVLPWRITSSLVDVTDIHGRDDDKNVLVSWLLGEKSPEEIHMAVPILSIVGTGGFGKTTLVQLVFKQEKVRFALPIWVCASQPFDREKVAKEIIEQATGNKATNFVGWDALHQQLSNSIKGKKFLFVLDDVWSKNPNDWTPLKLSLDGGAPGSRIIITTRDVGVARMMGSRTHMLAKLSDQECWSLFQQIAFFGRSQREHQDLEEIGKQISDKCKGVPLAAKTTGSLMQYKQSKMEWRNVLESDIWKMQHGEDGFLPSLLLSYYDLPSNLKQCFLYCAIFPKDWIIHKDELVKLWMAQGFLGLDGDKELEMIGGQYFDDLAMRSLFQDFEKDNGGKIIRCKMHDLVHDVVQFLTKTECAILRMNATGSHNNTKLRHINVGDSKYLESPSCFDMKKLHTLILRELNPVPLGMSFSQLGCLRSLVLRHSNLKKLPDEVGRLLHLRYLDLSFSELWELPKTMCDLYNLQTLKLTGCHFLLKLPEGFRRLLNLRHLECKDALKYFPQGFGKLKHLRTLTTFGVSKASGGCKLGELRDLNLIGGELEILGLHQVENIDEAKQAELQKKVNLVSLTLSFDMGQTNTPTVEGMLEDQNVKYDPGFKMFQRNTPTVGQRNTPTVERILEGLQPHSYLEELIIRCYPGLALPGWMSKKVSNIVKLVLYKCQNCTQLPALGMLTSLESLRIRDCCSIKQVGVELLGIPELGSQHHQTAFPKLRELILQRLQEWEEWDLPLSLFSGQNEILPCLFDLQISRCPKLKALPAAISKLPSLEVLCLEKVSLSTDVFGISDHYGFINGKSIPSSSVPLYPELTTLKLYDMKEWKEEIHQITTIPIIMPNLRSLSILSCTNLKVIPNYLLSCNLRDLTIQDCPQLKVGMAPYNLQSLESLSLVDNVGVFSTSLAPLININTVQNFKSIRLCGWWISSLPQGLNHFTSLQKLVIDRCYLMDFNPVEELSSEHFPNLQELCIVESLLLTEQYPRVNWSNLSHISEIYVNRRRIRS